MSEPTVVAANSRAPSFADWMRGVQAQLEAALARNLPPGEAIPGRLHQAMRYASLDGGKRVRPLLVFAAGDLTDAARERLELAASAVELIHSYSLVHDDLPCMDDDVLRRGRPTCHVEYDEATALLVGDSLHLSLSSFWRAKISATAPGSWRWYACWREPVAPAAWPAVSRSTWSRSARH